MDEVHDFCNGNERGRAEGESSVQHEAKHSKMNCRPPRHKIGDRSSRQNGSQTGVGSSLGTEKHYHLEEEVNRHGAIRTAVFMRSEIGQLPWIVWWRCGGR